MITYFFKIDLMVNQGETKTIFEGHGLTIGIINTILSNYSPSSVYKITIEREYELDEENEYEE